MTTQSVEIRNATTGAVVDHCRGPSETGVCPRAGRDGVVACAGRLVVPPDADPRHGPLWVPPESRHCVLGWSLQAILHLKQAEMYHRQWLAGLAKEINHVRVRAEYRDSRFEYMTPSELERIGRWRWTHSHRAKSLDALERDCRERARMYLAFAEFRLRATPPRP